MLVSIIAMNEVRKKVDLARPGELLRLERKAGFFFGGSRVSSALVTWCTFSLKLMMHF